MPRAAQHFEELVSYLGLEETPVEVLACFIRVAFGPVLSSTLLVRKGLQARLRLLALGEAASKVVIGFLSHCASIFSFFWGNGLVITVEGEVVRWMESDQRVTRFVAEIRCQDEG